MSRRNKVSLSVYLEPEQAEALRLLSRATDIPAAVFVRRGIDRVLRLHADEIDEAKAKEASR